MVEEASEQIIGNPARHEYQKLKGADVGVYVLRNLILSSEVATRGKQGGSIGSNRGFIVFLNCLIEGNAPSVIEAGKRNFAAIIYFLYNRREACHQHYIFQASSA